MRPFSDALSFHFSLFLFFSQKRFDLRVLVCLFVAVDFFCCLLSSIHLYRVGCHNILLSISLLSVCVCVFLLLHMFARPPSINKNNIKILFLLCFRSFSLCSFNFSLIDSCFLFCFLFTIICYN